MPILFLILFLFFGCADISHKSEVQMVQKTERKSPDLASSINFYSLGEAALNERDFKTALRFFQLSDEANPSNIYVKENIIQLLETLSYFEPSYREQLIKSAEKYYSQGYYSNKILTGLARAYYFRNQDDEADKYFQLCLENDPGMADYISYYYFLDERFSKQDTTLLEKALKLSWKYKGEVISIAELYIGTNFSRAEEILKKVHQKWDDQQTFSALIEFYKQANELDTVISLLESALEEHSPLSDYHKTLLMSLYYRRADFEKIAENSDLCFQVGSEEVLRYLFFASVFSENYETALSTAEVIKLQGEPAGEVKVPFFALLANTYFHLERDEDVLEALLQIDDLESVRSFFLDMTEQGAEKNRIKNLAEALTDRYEDNNRSNFLLETIFSALDEPEKAASFLYDLDADFLKENGLLEIAAIDVLKNSDDPEQAKKFLAMRDDKKPSANEFIGIYYYRIEKDSLSLQYLTEEISVNSKPSMSIFIIASMVAENLEREERVIEILEKGIELYPDGIDILNALGYSYAKYEIISKYDLAEEYLKKALKIEEKNAMIWDSIAWLYFKKGQYEKALEAMEIPLAEDVEHSEIAYHLGEIYLKLSMKKTSEKYFRLAVELANNDPAVKISKKILSDRFGIVQKNNEE